MNEFEKSVKDVLAGTALLLLAIVSVLAIVALWPQPKPRLLGGCPFRGRGIPAPPIQLR